ncbi:MAG: alpha/beta fold hydrolase [Pseudomonadota bacterium]
METQRQLINIGEAEIHTEITGAGEPLLLVSGLGGTAAFWAGQVQTLATDYQVITHDHRGVGSSSPAPVVSSATEMADDVVRLMDALKIDSAHLVGHSTGGAIGQNIALKHPERVRTLTLSASWAGPTPLFIDVFRVRRDILINSGVRHYMMIGTLLASPAWAIEPGYNGMDDYLAARIANFPGLEVELARLNAVMTHDLRHRVAEISAPTGVISARDDALTPQSMSDELAARIPNAKQVVLSEGGHFGPVTVRDTYNAELTGLLATLQSMR